MHTSDMSYLFTDLLPGKQLSIQYPIPLFFLGCQLTGNSAFSYLQKFVDIGSINSDGAINTSGHYPLAVWTIGRKKALLLASKRADCSTMLVGAYFKITIFLVSV